MYEVSVWWLLGILGLCVIGMLYWFITMGDPHIDYDDTDYPDEEDEGDGRY